MSHLRRTLLATLPALAGLAIPAAAPAAVTVEVLQERTTASWLSATRGVLAFVDHDQLYAGPVDAPLPIEAVQRQALAAPVTGTDEHGAVVIVFSRCPNGRRPSCDLVVRSVTDGTTKRAAGANRAGVGERAIGMVKGALLFERIDRGHRVTYVRPAGTKASRRISSGTDDLSAWSGRWFTQYRVGDASDDAACADEFLDVVSLGGGKRQIHHQGCGEDGQSINSASFVDDHTLAFSVLAFSGTTFYRYDLRTGKRESAHTGKRLFSPVALPGRRYVAKVGSRGEDFYDPEFYDLVRVGGLTWN